MSNSGSTLDITLHDYNILGNCLADVVLPLTGTVVKDFTVMDFYGRGACLYAVMHENKLDL